MNLPLYLGHQFVPGIPIPQSDTSNTNLSSNGPHSMLTAQQYQQVHVPFGFVPQNQPSPQQIIGYLPNTVMTTQIQHPNSSQPHDEIRYHSPR